MKILVTDGMDKTALEQLKQNGHEVTEQFYPPEELGAALKEYDAVVVRSATKIRAWREQTTCLSRPPLPCTCRSSFSPRSTLLHIFTLTLHVVVV